MYMSLLNTTDRDPSDFMPNGALCARLSPSSFPGFPACRCRGELPPASLPSSAAHV